MPQPKSPLRHERTECGHVLHTNTLRILLIPLILMNLLTAVMLALAFPMVEKELQTTFTALVGFCILCQITGGLSMVYLLAGRRLEMNRDGVHLRYKYRKGVSILWSEVRDCGLSSQIPVQSGTVSVYFSKVELPLMGDQTKRVAQNRQTVMLQLSAADLSRLTREGLFTYCKACLGEDAPEAFQAHLIEVTTHEN